MVVVPAYAKVNLCLDVLGRRSDGRHELASVVVAVDWHDLVALAPAGSGMSSIEVTGPEAAGVPGAGRNLALRALAALQAAHPGVPPLIIRLHKRVPAAAGLGGGSADAAAVLRAAASSWAAGGDLVSIAASVGSDVPAQLAGGAVLATGHGERLRRLPATSLHLAIAIAGPSSTAAVYGALAPGECTDGRRAEQVAGLLDAGRPLDDSCLGSALEPAACRLSPELGRGLQRLRQATGATWHMTGSGGGAFALAAGAAAADAAAGEARRAGFAARACRTVAAPLFHLAP